MKKDHKKLFFHLYSTLTTSQIVQALKDAELTQNDWEQFKQHFKDNDGLWVRK